MQIYVCKSTHGEMYVWKSSYANVRKQIYVEYKVRTTKIRLAICIVLGTGVSSISTLAHDLGRN